MPLAAREVVGYVRSEMKIAEVTQDTNTVAQKPEETVETRVDKILASYNGKKANLIPILQQVQQEYGYLPEEALSNCIGILCY